jgi:hypothetical protein
VIHKVSPTATVYWIFVTATVSILTVGTNWNDRIPTHIFDGKGQREINSRYIIAHDNQIHILHDPEIWQMSCRL